MGCGVMGCGVMGCETGVVPRLSGSKVDESKLVTLIAREER